MTALAYPAIRVRHLWHRFGAKQVLHDVTFDVQQGEIFGFIGPNGAGKTTTIRVMATLLEPMAGRVEIDGIDVTMNPARVRKLIGYMPDHAGVYDRLTVHEYLDFFADAYQIRSIGVVDAVLELTDIGRLRDTLVATMSKGQKQRLQLARILLHDPKVLILDEPASDLDPRARIEIRDLLFDLQGLGKTILLSSHILSELADVCTSIGIIEQGRMVVSGPIDEIAQRLTHAEASEQPGPHSQREAWTAPPGHSGNAALAPTPAVNLQRQSVKLRVLAEPAAAMATIEDLPEVIDAQLVGNSLCIGYHGNDETIATIVTKLVTAGFGVVGIEQERSELERIFLAATDHRGGNA